MATKKMQKKMQKKNRRQQRTKRVGGGLTSFLRSCSSDPYIVKFVQNYNQAGESDDKPKHQKRFIDEDALELKKYFRKINQGGEPCENEKDALKTVRELFSNKVDFMKNYGASEDIGDRFEQSPFQQMFLEVAPVVNRDSFVFVQSNPMVRNNNPVELENDFKTNRKISMLYANPDVKTEAQRSNILLQKVQPKLVQKAENEASEYDLYGSEPEKFEYSSPVDESKRLPNTMANNESSAMGEIQKLEEERSKDMNVEAERKEGGAKKSHRRRNQRRNQRRNRSRKQ